jgi:RNA polymerase sigma-70 factor (ECF subfamily)
MPQKLAQASLECLQEWLAAARAGSSEALGRLLLAYRPYLIVTVQSQIKPDLQVKADPSDLVQETFLEAQRDFASFRGQTPEDLVAWLRRLLLNNLANLRRQYRGTEKRELKRELSIEDNPGVEQNPAVLDELTPQRSAVAREEADLIRRALDRLPENYRRVLQLRHQEDKSFAEVGRILNVSAEAARKLWTRAVVRLREVMEPPS